jgi:hypothetical protein
MFSFFQASVIAGISGQRLENDQFLNWVWVESKAVGKAQDSIPKAEIIGMATVSEHLPTQEKS